jgi:sugar lactone lactonase YvrE
VVRSWRAAPATAEAHLLAEGPLWDPCRRRLLWVDIVAGEVLEGVVDGSSIRTIRRLRFPCMVSALSVAADGTLLVAAQETLVVVEADGTRSEGPRVIPRGQRRRLNDGAADPAGRFLVGTLPLEGDSEHESLLRWEHDGTLSVLDDDLTLSNGLAWSTDGTLLYSVDTLRRVVSVRDYDVSTGAVGPRLPHLVLTDGLPDGLAVDADDHLWVAVWGAGEARRYSPDGVLVGRVAVEAPQVSNIAFAGDDLSLLVLTTASDGLTPGQLEEFPFSGRLFTTVVDVPGHLPSPWKPPPSPR